MNPELQPSSTGVADAVDRIAPSVAAVRTRRIGTTSAVSWRPGVLVASAIGVGHAPRVELVLPGGRALAADVRGTDPATDLAVIAVDTGLATAERRTEAPLRTGDFVFAAGRESSGLLHASFGYVGAAGGGWRTWRGAGIDAYVRLDGGLPPGLAGGAIGDTQGRLAGIASAGLARHNGIVLPPATVDRVVDALLAHGHVRRGHLGIAAQPAALPAGQRADDSAAATGLLVTGVADDSPAARGGVLVGDIIVTAGGQAVTTLDALRDRLGAEQIGAPLALDVLRGGNRTTLQVEVGELRAHRRC